MAEDTRDDHKRHDDKNQDQKPPDPAMMMAALVGVVIFIFLTLVYVAGAQGGKENERQAQEQHPEDARDHERNQQIRAWMQAPAK